MLFVIINLTAMINLKILQVKLWHNCLEEALFKQEIHLRPIELNHFRKRRKKLNIIKN